MSEYVPSHSQENEPQAPLFPITEKTMHEVTAEMSDHVEPGVALFHDTGMRLKASDRPAFDHLVIGALATSPNALLDHIGGCFLAVRAIELQCQRLGLPFPYVGEAGVKGYAKARLKKMEDLGKMFSHHSVDLPKVLRDQDFKQLAVDENVAMHHIWKHMRIPKHFAEEESNRSAVFGAATTFFLYRGARGDKS